MKLRLALAASAACLATAATVLAPTAPAVSATTGDAAVSASGVTAQAAEITWVLHKSSNPTDDERDAYARIEDAMSRAVGRYNANTDLTKYINVYYTPGVPTAEASNNGTLRFGSNRSFMSERTALHEISHTIGVGQNGGWYNLCNGGSGQWTGPIATRLLESWDGSGARINCGGSHIWPYGLNYDNEMSETNATRHTLLVQAMVQDGM